MRYWIVVAGLCALLAACGGGGGGGTPGPKPSPPAPAYYQPLAVGDTWTYTCHNTHNPAERASRCTDDALAPQEPWQAC